MCGHSGLTLSPLCLELFDPPLDRQTDRQKVHLRTPPRPSISDGVNSLNRSRCQPVVSRCVVYVCVHTCAQDGGLTIPVWT